MEGLKATDSYGEVSVVDETPLGSGVDGGFGAFEGRTGGVGGVNDVEGGGQAASETLSASEVMGDGADGGGVCGCEVMGEGDGGSPRTEHGVIIDGDTLFELMRMVIPTVERWMVKGDVGRRSSIRATVGDGREKNDDPKLTTAVVPDTLDRQIGNNGVSISESSCKRRRLNLN